MQKNQNANINETKNRIGISGGIRPSFCSNAMQRL